MGRGRERRQAQQRPGATDRRAGVWRGRSVARCFVSPDGMTVLVGKSAGDNDVVTFKLGKPRDFWLHVAGQSGSHVVVLNPEGLERLPRATRRFAAALAARHSKARRGGQVAVHATTCAEVRKPRGLPPGKVTLKRFQRLQASPAGGCRCARLCARM